MLVLRQEEIRIQQDSLTVQRESLAIQRETLAMERARIALARFHEVTEISRNAVRSKLKELIDVVSAARAWCSGKAWHDLYLTVKRWNGIDLHANRAASHRRGLKKRLRPIRTVGEVDLEFAVTRKPS